MKNFKQIVILIVIILGHILFTILIRNILSPIHYAPANLLFLELIGKKINFSFEILLIFDAGVLCLLYLIGKKIFQSNFFYVPPLIYAIVPWGMYLTAANSFYIYLSFLVLLMFYGLLLVRSDQKGLGTAVVIIISVFTVYCSLFLLAVIPVIFILIIVLKIISLKSLKLPLIALLILIIPLIFISYKNVSGFKNILINEIKIFSDPGLINNVNYFQGEARDDNLGLLAKISENKYIFSSEFVLAKYIKQLIPSTFFTSQEKLLDFSFSPPIYLGFLIPFFYGLYLLTNSSLLRRTFFISTLLAIPSLLSKQTVDLNRLIIFTPVIILVISYGIIQLFIQRKNKIKKAFLVLSVFLVLFQIFVTASDIQLREKERFIKYNEQNFEISKQ